MAIQRDINQRLDVMIPEETPQEPMLATEEAVVGEPVQVAGLGTSLMREIVEPLVKKGARTAEATGVAPKVMPVKPQAITPPPVTQPVPAPVAPSPTRPSLAPASMTEVQQVTQRIDEIKGQEFAPSPTPRQEAAGVQTGPINTLPFDNEEMKATVAALAERSAIDSPTMSVRSMFQSAVAAGVPKKQAERIFSGLDMESTVGGNALAKNVAGLLKLHDDSAAELDGLFLAMRDGKLDDAGKMQLRQRMTAHDLIVKQLSGVQVDVARSMNAFKRIRDKGPALGRGDMQSILDEFGGDSDLTRIAEAYISSPDRAGKNRLISQGLGGKLWDTWIYTWQSNLLNDPATHLYNWFGGLAFGALQPVEQTIALGIGKARHLLKIGDADRYHGEDILAGLSGLHNGTVDAWAMAGRVIRHGENSAAKGDAKLRPFSAENFSHTPVRAFGKEFGTTPDLTDTWVGKTIDGIGFLQSLSFRALATGDEFVSGLAMRYQLHQDAYRFGHKVYDDLVAGGMTHDDAIKETQQVVSQFLTDRPPQMQASIDDFRQMVTFQEKLSRETPIAEGYWKADRIANNPMLKVYVPFSKTILNVFDQGTARIPGMNLISPQFWKDWKQGGRHKDLAMARLSLGASITAATTYYGLEGRWTGSGPVQVEDLKSLEAQGWQKYSLVFDPDELSPAIIAALSEKTKVSQAPSGKVYVSYARFDPISQLIAVGADMSDAIKLHQGDANNIGNDLADLALIAAGANAEYVSSLPVMAGVGEIMQIMRSRVEDKGDMLLRLFDGFSRQYADVAITGTPLLGMSNSTLIAHIERLTDPEKRSSMADVMDAPDGLRAFYATRQRWVSRIPGMSDEVPLELDNLGRTQLADVRGPDYWLNYMPIIKARKEKVSEIDALLSEHNFGISKPPITWDGVILSATQYNRFKRLYGQEIKLEDQYGTPRNLESALINEIHEANADSLERFGAVRVGFVQQRISAKVSEYRDEARKRMIGKWDNELQMFTSEQPVEYPELQVNVMNNRINTSVKGK